MSLPLIGEKVKSGAITENKQKDLTKSSSTLLFDGEAPSLLFFYFSLPVISKISLCGRTFWHGYWYNSTYNATVDD